MLGSLMSGVERGRSDLAGIDKEGGITMEQHDQLALVCGLGCNPYVLAASATASFSGLYMRQPWIRQFRWKQRFAPEKEMVHARCTWPKRAPGWDVSPRPARGKFLRTRDILKVRRGFCRLGNRICSDNSGRQGASSGGDHRSRDVLQTLQCPSLVSFACSPGLVSICLGGVARYF